jgi:transcriptional regulator with GAF, ATPase, and Fis domain
MQTDWERTMDSSLEQWRRDLNRSVRDFAAAAASLDEETLQAFINTMLREAGEALVIDCCALVEVDDRPSDAPTYSWSRNGSEGGEHAFESPTFAAMVEGFAFDRQPLTLPTVADDGDEPAVAQMRAFLREGGVGAALFVPLAAARRTVGWWVFGASADEHVWREPVIEHLQMLADVVSGALQSRRREPREVAAAAAVPISVARLPTRGRAAPPVRNAFALNLGIADIVGDSPSLLAALASLDEVVDADSSVLLLGETGTGKELFARALHARGPRRTFPLVSVNCAALPPTLIESELFGHQRGAFTGAIAVRQGRFELAHRGTLFLDEIGDLPLDLQAKLLRVLQEGGFERVGSSQTQSVDVRIIGATHRDLGRAVNDGEFRADLFYRLNVFPIRLPPLRERREDIPALVWSIIRRRQGALRRHIVNLPAEAIKTLQQHSWPGNIRELENVVERALIHSTGDTLILLDRNLETFDREPAADTLMSVERAHIEGVLRDCGWRINGLGNAAERLGLHPNTLRFRMKKLGIVRREPAREAPGVRPSRRAWTA